MWDDAFSLQNMVTVVSFCPSSLATNEHMTLHRLLVTSDDGS